MNFIKRFFSGGVGDWVHGRFTRYGRGVFVGPIVEAKVGRTIKVSGSEDYCNILGFVVVESCPGLFSVNGSIVGKSDFRGVLKESGLPFKDKSKKGLYSVEVSGDLSSDALRKVYVNSKDASVLLSLKSVGDKDFSLKCKKKLPKPGGKKDDDFVMVSLGASALKLLREEVFFDAVGDFTMAKVWHVYIINEIVMPAGVKDPARIRIESKRKGFVERKLAVDGKENASKTDFAV